MPSPSASRSASGLMHVPVPVLLLYDAWRAPAEPSIGGLASACFAAWEQSSRVSQSGRHFRRLYNYIDINLERSEDSRSTGVQTHLQAKGLIKIQQKTIFPNEILGHAFVPPFYCLGPTYILYCTPIQSNIGVSANCYKQIQQPEKQM